MPAAAVSAEAFLYPGEALQIPNVLGNTLEASALLPDSEVIYSPAVKGFNLADFIGQYGGTLSTYEETILGNRMTGVEIVEKVAVELSVNPRLLLALLEFLLRLGNGFARVRGCEPPARSPCAR
jgi:hypothetical protein